MREMDDRDDSCDGEMDAEVLKAAAATVVDSIERHMPVVDRGDDDDETSQVGIRTVAPRTRSSRRRRGTRTGGDDDDDDTRGDATRAPSCLNAGMRGGSGSACGGASTSRSAPGSARRRDGRIAFAAPTAEVQCEFDEDDDDFRRDYWAPAAAGRPSDKSPPSPNRIILTISTTTTRTRCTPRASFDRCEGSALERNAPLGRRRRTRRERGRWRERKPRRRTARRRGEETRRKRRTRDAPRRSIARSRGGGNRSRKICGEGLGRSGKNRIEGLAPSAPGPRPARRRSGEGAEEAARKARVDAAVKAEEALKAEEAALKAAEAILFAVKPADDEEEEEEEAGGSRRGPSSSRRPRRDSTEGRVHRGSNCRGSNRNRREATGTRRSNRNRRGSNRRTKNDRPGWHGSRVVRSAPGSDVQPSPSDDVPRRPSPLPPPRRPGPHRGRAQATGARRQ